MVVKITRITKTAAGAQWRCTAVIRVTVAGSSTPVGAAAAGIRWHTLFKVTGFPYTSRVTTAANGQGTAVSSRVPTGKGCRLVVTRVTKAGFNAVTSTVSASLAV